MMHVKGLAFAHYEPRGFQGIGLGYGTSSRGACHNVGGWTIRDELLTKTHDRFATKGKGALVKTLQDLVKIPSVTGEERNIAEKVSEELEKLGLTSRIDKYRNVYSEVGSGKSILLNAHLDTVPPGNGWTINPYSGKVTGNKVYGLGASDNKSGISAMLEIAKVVNQNNIEGKILLVFTSGEEGIKKSSMRIPKRIKADAGISLDNPINIEKKVVEIVIGCRSFLNFAVKVFGRSYHSSEPDKGINAIYRAVRFIEKFQKLKFPKMNKPVKERSIGSITKINTDGWPTQVPDLCELVVNYRAIPCESPSKIKSRIRDVACKALKNNFELNLMGFHRGYLLNKDEDIVSVAKSSIAELRFKHLIRIAKGWEDAATFHNLNGVPIIGLGPTTPGQAHVNDEYENIANLVYGSEAVLRTIMNYFKA